MDGENTLVESTSGYDIDDDFEPWNADADDSLPRDRYIDRELSWLAFNQRVLELAEDRTLPLLERSNFLAIFASNLDEFFMVRVAGLKRRIMTGLAVPTNTGKAPLDVLTDVSAKAQELQLRHARVFQEVAAELRRANITLASWDSLGEDERAPLREVYAKQIFPVLMPLAVDPAHPFPYISGLSLNLAVRVRNPKTAKEQFARLKVPTVLPRFVRIDGTAGVDQIRYILLEDLIANQLDDLFPGMEVMEHHVFRVTRNEDVEIDEDETENLIQALEKELLRRRFGPPIRLEVTEDIDQITLDLLVRELDITEQEIYRLPAPLDLRALFDLSRLDRPELKYPPHVPVTAAQLQPSEPNAKPDIFAALRRQDVLVHHPYESFATSVQAFLEQAARDPNVLAIKQTLYRTSGDSPIVEALIDAAEAGKQVLALVEIKARFDEQNNIEWARKLEKAGVHVVYGLVGLKTHCKLALVIRQEGGQLKHYSHVGTGNYNPKTSRIYEDLGLFTADDQVGKDLTRLFNELSGYAIEKKFKRLLVAPLHLRKGLLKAIDQERHNAEAGKPSGIRIKVNSMVDEAIIDALYRASRAGVKVDVWVRGICGLKAGQEGYSENIRVKSVLGRYLEHSRVFSFDNDGDPVVYIGSADMMHRNLDRRVEALVRLTKPEHIAETTAMFDLAMSEDTASWSLESDGTWVRRSTSDSGAPLVDLQNRLMYLISHRPPDRDPPVTDDIILAAGAVCWRVVDGEVKVLVIHRPHYDDLTLPKGKVDPGETLPQAAVREVREETDLRIGLGSPIGTTRYTVPSGREKIVHYWAAEVTDAALAACRFKSNAEVDAITWLTLPKARAVLSHEHDARLLDDFEAQLERSGGATFGVIVLRHAKALARSDWSGPDTKRPLAARGLAQARAVVPSVRAFAPRRLITSPAVRCVATITPLAKALDRRLRFEPGISQDAWEEGMVTIPAVVQKRLASGRTAVLCSHRPVIPDILREFAYAVGEPMGDRIRDASVLDTASFTVMHFSSTRSDAGLLALETHDAPR